MIWMAAPFTLGWLLILLPYSLAMEGSAALWMFYLGRFLSGRPTEKLYNIKHNIKQNTF